MNTLRPLNSDERSGAVVNLGEICNFHVRAMLLLRHWQVLTVPDTFLLGSYYAPIMRAQGPIILATSKKIALCVYHILTVSFRSLQIQQCTMTRATSFKLDYPLWITCSLLSAKSQGRTQQDLGILLSSSYHQNRKLCIKQSMLVLKESKWQQKFWILWVQTDCVIVENEASAWEIKCSIYTQIVRTYYEVSTNRIC